MAKLQLPKLQLPEIERGRGDYWRLGPVYVWKWAVLAVLAALAVPALSLFGLPSFPMPARTPPAYRYDDPKLAQVSGTVRVLDGQGVLRYEGEVAAGTYAGLGKVYDADGRLVYDGPLADGFFEGQDAKVYEEGRLVYTGEMSKNQYEGQGRRTDWRAGIVSEGQFSKGKLEGEGRQYDQNGTLLRSGTFADDLLNGPGLEYGQNGILLREGEFSGGVLHGSGIQYSLSGALQYEGQFQRGLYHGQGKLYQSGALSYEGEFVNGMAVGQGSVRHPSGQVLYQGVVYDGQPRADAFLGLSLTEVEQAFREHWLLYVCGEAAAFVYPSFQLMFVAEGPVELASAAMEDAQAESRRQELLGALARQDPEAEPPQDWAEAPAGGPQDEAVMDFSLSPEAAKGDIVIREVLSYGGPLPGAPQPAPDSPAGRRPAGWRERFSDYAAGEAQQAAAVQIGAFVYEFPETGGEPSDTDYRLAGKGGVLTSTVWREGKTPTLWYQSAVQEDGP